MRSNPMVKSCVFVWSMLLLGILGMATVHVAGAQLGTGEWSVPVKLFEGQQRISEPIVVADNSGMVHVFWLYGETTESQQIYYTRWNGKTWADPVDVVASSGICCLSAAVDPSGYIHLIWYGPQGLTYSRSTVEHALSAAAWAEPVSLAQSLAHAQIRAGSKGQVHVVYPGTGSSGPFYLASDDSGATWKPAQRISKTSTSNSAADWAYLALGKQGIIHAAWTEFQLPDGWPPIGVFYSRSLDGGQTWSEPLQLAGEGYDQMNVVVVDDKTVVAVWNGIVGVGGRYYSRSEDGGQTWSETLTLTPSGYSEGPAPLAVDSAGMLHLTTTYGQRVWYSYWRNGRWANLAYVPSGDESGIPPLGESITEKLRHIEHVSMALSGGNRLHAVFFDERPQQQRNYVWYTTRQTSAPAVAPVPFPKTTPAATASPTARVQQATATPRATVPSGDMGADPSAGSGLVIFVSASAAILVIGGVLVAKVVRDRRM